MQDYPCIFNDLGTVSRYDKLRHVAPRVISAVCNLVYNQARLHTEPFHILDAGAGTGRFLIPIAKKFESRCDSAVMYAVDVCRAMLVSLQERWIILNGRVLLRCIEADLQEPLPIPDELIHVVFTIGTFHILKKWREALQNLVRVLTPGGFFIFIRENNQFMHETEGFEKDSDFPWLDAQLQNFMHYYHQQRAIVGEPYQPRELRYSDMMPAVCYLAKMGLDEQQLDLTTSAFEWDKPHTYIDILHCFRKRQMTTWGSDLSDEAREKIAKALDEWVLSRGIDINREFLLPAKLIPHVFRKPR